MTCEDRQWSFRYGAPATGEHHLANPPVHDCNGPANTGCERDRNETHSWRENETDDEPDLDMSCRVDGCNVEAAQTAEITNMRTTDETDNVEWRNPTQIMDGRCIGQAVETPRRNRAANCASPA